MNIAPDETLIIIPFPKQPIHKAKKSLLHIIAFDGAFAVECTMPNNS